MKATVTPSNVWAYLQGKIREQLFYSKYFSRLLPLHIFEQINYRLFVMNKQCYTQGSCIVCGCDTPGLQMADKACDGDCYPKMMNSMDWDTHKYFNKIEFTYHGKKKDRNFELRITKKTIIS